MSRICNLFTKVRPRWSCLLILVVVLMSKKKCNIKFKHAFLLVLTIMRVIRNILPLNDLFRSSQYSRTGVTKAVVCVSLSVG